MPSDIHLLKWMAQILPVQQVSHPIISTIIIILRLIKLGSQSKPPSWFWLQTK